MFGPDGQSRGHRDRKKDLLRRENIPNINKRKEARWLKELWVSFTRSVLTELWCGTRRVVQQRWTLRPENKCFLHAPCIGSPQLAPFKPGFLWQH
eukprot:1156458-Pelagomonas_calceolata.AAC.6